MAVGAAQGGPATRGAALQDQVGPYQPARRVEQAPQQRIGDGPGRVGHHTEGASRQAKVGGVGLHHPHLVAKAVTQRGGSAGVHLDGDHVRADLEEWCDEGSAAGADVEHQVAPGDA